MNDYYTGSTEIVITPHDAGSWCLYEQDQYDKILLDAPCSSEAHVLTSEKHLKQWSVKRTKGLAQIQYKMLASALIALKPGGRLVYSTCSISPLENDDVIKKIISKKKGKLVDYKCDQATTTEFGHMFLPHKNSMGPIYLIVLTK